MSRTETPGGYIVARTTVLPGAEVLTAQVTYEYLRDGEEILDSRATLLEMQLDGQPVTDPVRAQELWTLAGWPYPGLPPKLGEDSPWKPGPGSGSAER